jgi:acyl-CoA thioesterase FadM
MYTELGRIDFLVRTGLLKWCLKNNVFAAFATAHISFRRSLRRFQKLELRSKLIYWDKEWIWIEQKIYCKIKGEVKLSSSLIVKAKFKKGKETVPFEEIIKNAGFQIEHKPKPNFILDLEVAEANSILS